MTILDEHIDDQDIQTKLFVVDGEYRVRVRDLAAKENISLVICRNLERALVVFDEATA